MKLLISLAAAATLAACAPGQNNTEDDMASSPSTTGSAVPTGATPPVLPEDPATAQRAPAGPGEVPGPAIRQDQADASPRPGSEAAPAPGDGPAR